MHASPMTPHQSTLIALTVFRLAPRQAKPRIYKFGLFEAREIQHLCHCGKKVTVDSYRSIVEEIAV